MRLPVLQELNPSGKDRHIINENLRSADYFSESNRDTKFFQSVKREQLNIPNIHVELEDI